MVIHNVDCLVNEGKNDGMILWSQVTGHRRLCSVTCDL